MNYEEAIEYIHNAPKMCKKAGNDNLSEILHRLGTPQKDLKFVHIAGTNGKGSTAAMTEAVLRCAGYKTGLFISPFIERFNERIKINGEDIQDEVLADITERVKNTIEVSGAELYEFAIILTIAFLYYKENNCDIVILETGLGGRLDATNVIDSSLVSAITSIGFDHTQYLGNTIKEIAAEKAGIIKENGVVVVYPGVTQEVTDVICSVATERNAKVSFSSFPDVENGVFVFDKMKFKPGLEGDYQKSNVTVAMKVIDELKNKGLKIHDSHITAGMENTKWPGRFEWLTDRILLDGCHNPEGAVWFKKSLKNMTEPVNLVVGMMCDKEYSSVAAELSTVASHVITTAPDVPRALDPDELKKIFKESGVPVEAVSDSAEAVKKALEMEGICAVCGSLYLIGEVRKKFKPHIE